MKFTCWLCVLKRLLLTSIVFALCNTHISWVAETVGDFKTPVQTIYLEQQNSDNVTEHYIIHRYDSPGHFPVESVLKITPGGIQALDALPPLAFHTHYNHSENEHQPNMLSDIYENRPTSNDEDHQSKNLSNYLPRQLSSRFSVSPYMAEKLSLGNRAQKQARQRMFHASHAITPSYYQAMLLDGNIKEVKAALATLQHKYNKTKCYQLLTWLKLRNQIKDIQQVLQKDHAQNLDTKDLENLPINILNLITNIFWI